MVLLIASTSNTTSFSSQLNSPYSNQLDWISLCEWEKLRSFNVGLSTSFIAKSRFDSISAISEGCLRSFQRISSCHFLINWAVWLILLSLIAFYYWTSHASLTASFASPYCPIMSCWLLGACRPYVSNSTQLWGWFPERSWASFHSSPFSYSFL